MIRGEPVPHADQEMTTEDWIGIGLAFGTIIAAIVLAYLFREKISAWCTPERNNNGTAAPGGTAALVMGANPSHDGYGTLASHSAR